MVNLSVEEPDALMRARPDLWEPWRATARATRPGASNRDATLDCRTQTDARWESKRSASANDQNQAVAAVDLQSTHSSPARRLHQMVIGFFEQN